MPSFDIVSEIDIHEVQNAFNQISQEFNQRFDFRNTGVKIKHTLNGFYLNANSEERIKAAFEVLCDKFLKRKLSLKFLNSKKEELTNGQNWKKEVILKKGIDKENAKKIIKLIKTNKELKVTTSIHGESIRVIAKKKDDLQSVISMIKEKNLSIEISFNNFRN